MWLLSPLIVIHYASKFHGTCTPEVQLPPRCHHVKFLQECIDRKITPKGLQINLFVNVINPAASTVLNDIKEICAMAEAEVILAILHHYQSIVQGAKEISLPTPTTEVFKQKIRLSEEFIKKHQRSL